MICELKKWPLTRESQSSTSPSSSRYLPIQTTRSFVRGASMFTYMMNTAVWSGGYTEVFFFLYFSQVSKTKQIKCNNNYYNQ